MFRRRSSLGHENELCGVTFTPHRKNLLSADEVKSPVQFVSDARLVT